MVTYSWSNNDILYWHLWGRHAGVRIQIDERNRSRMNNIIGIGTVVSAATVNRCSRTRWFHCRTSESWTRRFAPCFEFKRSGVVLSSKIVCIEIVMIEGMSTSRIVCVVERECCDFCMGYASTFIRCFVSCLFYLIGWSIHEIFPCAYWEDSLLLQLLLFRNFKEFSTFIMWNMVVFIDSWLWMHRFFVLYISRLLFGSIVRIERANKPSCIQLEMIAV